jgi:kumamolisin
MVPGMRAVSVRTFITATAMLGCFAASPALASTNSTPVAGGVDAAAIPGSTVFGTTPADTPETVSFILREQNLGQLEAQDEGGFHSFLSTSQFAATYGAAPVTIAALESYLKPFGISTTAYADDVDVVATGTAGEFDKALSVTQNQYRTPAVAGKSGTMSIPAQTFHGVSGNPSVPSSLASQIVAILGLTNYAPNVSSAEHVNNTEAKDAKAEAVKNGTASQACIAASGLPNDCNLPSDYASQYGLDPVYQQGATGKGQTLGIVTLAPVDDAVGTNIPSPVYFWTNVLGIKPSGRTLTIQNIDGGAPPDPGNSIETDLDIEQSGAIATGANIDVYVAPNTDSGFADAFFTAASQDVAGSMSSSWGESETYLESLVALGQDTSQYEAALDEAFLEYDAQGQANFLSSGDSGAYDANGDLGTYNLSVDTSADSPYATAAGGSTLPWSADLGPAANGKGDVYVNVPQQRIWGWDYLWQPIASLLGISVKDSIADYGIGGGGGGFSQLEPEPSYQRSVPGTSSYTGVPYLTGTDYDTANGLLLPEDFDYNLNPGLSFGFSGGRAVPDLATNADPESGYEVYAPGGPAALGVSGPLFDGLGGTSFAAPQLNGVTAVIDSLLDRRVGFWNPSIYRFATSWGSPFTPLNATGKNNDNLYYTGTPGTLYNDGAGLGLPNFAELASDFGSQR